MKWKPKKRNYEEIEKMGYNVMRSNKIFKESTPKKIRVEFIRMLQRLAKGDAKEDE